MSATHPRLPSALPLRPAPVGGDRPSRFVHVLPDDGLLPPADLVVIEQDTGTVLAPAGTLAEPDETLAALVDAMVEQEPLAPGRVVAANRAGDRLFAVVHDLEREPSWCGAWVRSCIDEVLALAHARGARSLRLPPLGAVHGRYPLRAFCADLHAALAARPLPKLRDLWLVVPPRKCSRLAGALSELPPI